MYRPILKTFYHHRQVMSSNIDKSFSKSPMKPKLLLQYLRRCGIYKQYMELQKFRPFEHDEFKLAHTAEYVDAVFNGTKPLCLSNGLPWSPELANSLRYTSSSLYNALEYASQNPECITFSPTSGFHHSSPRHGSGFCTFSGQVIASVKLYRKYGLKTAWLDLDGHFGNSIEDTREFLPDLSSAVPPGFNINPDGKHEFYIESLIGHLSRLESAVLAGTIDCIVWAHGADSHQDDDLGGSCTTEEWLKCATLFYTWVKQLNEKRGKPISVTLTLFGGYRADDYQSVLSLHTADLVECLNILCSATIRYTPQVKR